MIGKERVPAREFRESALCGNFATKSTKATQGSILKRAPRSPPPTWDSYVSSLSRVSRAKILRSSFPVFFRKILCAFCASCGRFVFISYHHPSLPTNSSCTHSRELAPNSIEVLFDSVTVFPVNGSIVSLKEVAALREQWRREGHRVVATNGCFDLLHVGHLRYLSQARAFGDRLWIGLNSDASVRQLKGPTRPVTTQEDRAEVMASLRVVDAVTIFDGMRATEFLEAVKPDVYVKGGDYTIESLDPDERAVLERIGCRIEIVGLVPGKSTTATLQRAATPAQK